MVRTLEEALARIEKLEKEIEELKEKLSAYENKKPAGRKTHNEAWSEAYNDFVVKFEDGMSIAEIVETGNISRRTAYRYKKYYDLLKRVEN